MSTESAPACPRCGGPLRDRGMVLCRREEDDRRVCRAVRRCSGGHVWWQWTDRAAAPWEVCPYPDLFR